MSSNINNPQQLQQPVDSLVEPLIDTTDIQGNILVGFDTQYNHFLFLQISDPVLVKQWLEATEGQITTLQHVLDSTANQVRMNIAFSFQGLSKLTDQTKDFEEAFQDGMANRPADIFQDPTDPQMEGNVANWVLGGRANDPEIVLIIGSDDLDALHQRVADLKAGLQGMTVAFEQAANLRQDTLENYTGAGAPVTLSMNGHEHFGFRDGISQPAPRGRISDSEFVSERNIAPADPRYNEYAKPGQNLVALGEFLFGYNLQDPDDPAGVATEVRQPAPWAKNGSYLAIRRFRQDVQAFWDFVAEQSKAMNLDNPYQFSAAMFGRWPSGAPLMRTSETNSDNLALANNPDANNSFNYTNASTPYELTAGSEPDPFPPAPADVDGTISPFASHLVKMNPRDTIPGVPRAFVQTHRMLRRSIPYGEPLQVVPGQTVPDLQNGNRGLMFLSYQTSIEEQFEFLFIRGANEKSFLQPDAGEDPIFGQRNETVDGKDDRTRTFRYQASGADKPNIINNFKDFVVTTGGEYYFQPSLTALRTVLSK